MINVKKLRGRRAEVGLTLGEMAITLGITPYTLGKKMSGAKRLTLEEAFGIQKILEIPDCDFVEYFCDRSNGTR